MPPSNSTKSKTIAGPGNSNASTKSSSLHSGSTPKAAFITTGAPLSKVRTTKINYPVRKKRLSSEERKKLARARWVKAIRRVKAMLRFKIPINFKEEEDKPQRKLAPTYKMVPDPGKKYNESTVENLIETVLEDRLKEYVYSRFTAPKFAKLLSSVLNDRVKELDFPRYKFVTNVIISENLKQSMSFTSRAVWNDKTDGFATAEFVRPTFIAVASIHAVYLD